MSLARADSFVRVNITGIGPMLDTLENVASAAASGETLRRVLRRAAIPIRDGYRDAALTHDATGNLAASTTIKPITYRPGVSVVVVGPRHTGNMGATTEVPSGNHSWLVEFGSNGRRSPSARGRRKTYINVHQIINQRMTRVARLEDSDDFANRSKGYYFLMSSWREPTRQARAGKGYPHDFLPGRKVYTLHPGETYGAMPAYHLMENTIRSRRSTSERILREGLVNAINEALSGTAR